MSSRGVLLADEMGLGKTIQIAGVINQLDLKTILIVCPATLKRNWQTELEKWLVAPRAIHVFGRGSPFRLEDGISIINYDWLEKFKDGLTSRTWDLVVADESHAIKSSKARRTRAFLKIPAHRKILATGTPILNRPSELWTSIKYLWPDIWTDWHWFVTVFCGAKQGRWGFDTSGATNLRLLNKLLRSYGMIRRTKAIVLPDLPPKFHQVIEVPCEDTGLINLEVIKYKEWRNAQARLKRLERQSRKTDDINHKNRLQELRQAVMISFGELSKARHDTAVYKIPTVVAHLKSCIEAGKVVCFVHHRDVAEALRKAFEQESVQLIGGMSEVAKNAAVHRFQNHADCRLFIGSISAAGTGITLTASSHVVCAELDWTPAKMSQAIDRCHRIGQKDNVLAQYIVLEGSIDAMIAKKLVKKELIIEKVMK